MRRLQVVEFSYAEKMKESSGPMGRLNMEEQMAMQGVCRATQQVMVAPALIDFVKADLSKEVDLLKGLRKIREEKDHARKSQKGGHQDKG